MATETETWERLLEALDSYERGLSDAPYIQKWADKSTGRGDEGPMSFVVSTDEVDRHGDTISVEGWRYDAYIRNPVFLWAHNYTRPAIGRAIKVWKEQHSLLAEIEFAPTGFRPGGRSPVPRGISIGGVCGLSADEVHHPTGPADRGLPGHQLYRAGTAGDKRISRTRKSERFTKGPG